jgi:hypothetical protein
MQRVDEESEYSSPYKDWSEKPLDYTFMLDCEEVGNQGENINVSEASIYMKESCQVTLIGDDNYDDLDIWAKAKMTSRSLLMVNDPVVPSRNGLI